jgi:hypothetical protein
VEDGVATAPELEEEIVDVDEHDVAGPAATPLSHYGTDFDVHGLVRRLENNDIVIPTFDPDQPTESGLEGFQRRFVWRKPQMDRFIESLLLGYPVPGVFLVEEPNKKRGGKKVGLGGGAVGPECAPRVLSTEAVQRAVRVNVTCVTPLGEEVAST